MNCDFTEKISQLIDGELSEIEAREVQRHLTRCVACQEAQADFLSFRSEISNYNPSLHPAAQADALKRILGQPVEQPRITRAKPKLGWRWSFASRAIAFASFILIAALTGFIVYRATQNKQVEPPQITQKNPLPLFVPTPQVTPNNHEPGHADPPKSDSAPAKSKQIRRMSPLVRDGSNIAQVQPDADTTQPSNSEKAGDMQALTAMHLQKSELLLRAFRNVRTSEAGRPAEIDYERKLAQQLIVRNMMLKREADVSGDIQVSSLLENLEPILLDIANLPKDAGTDEIRVINERVERKNIVALLQVNSTVLARALDDD
ncbi:MAG TPA: zf-HC2 domain-containing protein [Pyrinomonadaceae bacterium]|nr:zf-HC2 domain-containing protein [Pyrinomonadaceae bacterium]